MPKNNRDKSRKNETDSSEIQIQSIYGVLGAEITDKKCYSYIGLKSQIKAFQIKENWKENQSEQNQNIKDVRKEAEIKEIRWERESIWNTIRTTYKRKDLEANRKAWYKHALHLREILRSIR